MKELFRALDPTRWAMLGAVILLLVLAIFVIGRCSQGDAIRKARGDATVAGATGEALDRVAKETPAIREDQKEKERAVDEIPGADERLPDGFGADLERVRRGGRERNDP